jgi:fucose 4-O-acetylase-like acetyltransferase
MRPRRLDVDLAKAIGTVAVVLIHSLRPYFHPEISRGEQ